MFSFCISRPRRIGQRTCCGVVTTIAPATGTCLAQAERHVTGAGREIDHEVVEVGPRHSEELLQRAGAASNAPIRRIVAREEAHGDDLEPNFSAGTIFLPSVVSCVFMPSMIGVGTRCRRR
jgi:hypothetical protein